MAILSGHSRAYETPVDAYEHFCVSLTAKTGSSPLGSANEFSYLVASRLKQNGSCLFFVYYRCRDFRLARKSTIIESHEQARGHIYEFVA
jgi:hypothetical protein